MNKVSQEFTLGFFDTNGIFTVYAKQYDTQRELVFYLEDDLVEHILEKNTICMFREEYSDHTTLFPTLLPKQALDAEGHKLTIQLTKDMLAVAGVARCEIAFLQTDGTITLDENGDIPDVQYDILTTQDFNINIKPSVTGDINDFDPSGIDALTRLAIALGVLQQEVTEGEKERKRAEKERRAYEASGDYLDEEGNEHTISWPDSRKGANERIVALTHGGTYTDESGEHTVVNQYTNLKGEVITPNVSDLEGISFIALAAYMKSLSDNNYWARLSESFAHGGTNLEDRPNEDTDNAEYYAHRAAENQVNSKNYMERTEEILTALEGYLDANLPDAHVNLDDGHLYWEGGIFNFLVTYYDGHLRWEAIANGDVIVDGEDADIIQLAAKLNSLQQQVQRLQRQYDSISLDLSQVADKATLDQVKEDADFIKSFIEQIIDAEDDA